MISTDIPARVLELYPLLGGLQAEQLQQLLANANYMMVPSGHGQVQGGDSRELDAWRGRHHHAGSRRRGSCAIFPRLQDHQAIPAHNRAAGVNGPT